MAEKVIVCEKNTPFAKVINRQSPDQTPFGPNFENQEVKDEFINSKLFNNGDYKKLLENARELKFTDVNVEIIEIIINKNDYPNETVETLKQKDFAITYDTINQLYRFWYLTNGRRENNLIYYIGTLAKWFTYDVKKVIGKQNSIFIEQGHVNNFDKDKQPLLGFDNPNLLTPETFEGVIGEESMLPVKREILSRLDGKNITKYFTNPQDIPSELEKIVFQGLNNGTYVTYMSKIDGASGDEPTITVQDNTLPFDFTNNGSATMFSFKDGPIFIDQDEWYITYSTNDNGDTSKFWYVPLVNAQDSRIIAEATTTHFTSWIDYLYEDIKNKTPFINITINNTNKSIDFEIAINTQGSESIYQTWATKADLTYVTFTPYPNRGIKRALLKTPIEVYDDFSTLSFNINDPTDDLRELKLQYAPYKKIRIKGTTTFQFDIFNQWLGENKQISFYQTINWTPDFWQCEISITYDKNTPTLSYKNLVDSGMVFVDTSTYSYPSLINTYNENATANKNRYQQNMVNAKQNEIMGSVSSATTAATGMGIGITTGNPIAAGTGAIAGTFGIAKAVLQYHQAKANQNAMFKDFKNTPNKFESNGNSLQKDELCKNLMHFAYTLKVNPNMEERYAKFFRNFGYALNSYLNLWEFLFGDNQRYYFNFVKTGVCIQALNGLYLGENIKQKMQDDLQAGITFVHIRSNSPDFEIDNLVNLNNVELYNAQISKQKTL